MHDLKTIQKINAEEFKTGDRVQVRAHPDERIVGKVGAYLMNDQSGYLPHQVWIEGEVVMFNDGEIEKIEPVAQPDDMRSAHEAALKVLDAHAIQPFWQRSGYQIRELLVEAILAERGLIKPEA